MKISSMMAGILKNTIYHDKHIDGRRLNLAKVSSMMAGIFTARGWTLRKFQRWTTMAKGFNNFGKHIDSKKLKVKKYNGKPLGSKKLDFHKFLQ